MLLRGVVVLAVVAALIGAPSTASAAANTLHAPVISPTIGSPTTTFTLRVSYAGHHAAERVDAAVANRSLALTRVSGTPEAGTWQASTTLPSGTWPVTFTATTDRGNSPVLAAGSVVVGGVAAPLPTSGPTPKLAPPAPTPQSVGPFPPPESPPADPAPAWTPAPPSGSAGAAPAEPTAAPDPIARKPVPSSSADVTDEPSDAPAADGGDPTSGPHPSVGADATPISVPGSSGEPRGNSAPVHMTSTTGGEPAMTDELVSDAVGILAMWGVLLGVASALMLLFAMRRRNRATPEPAAMSLADETSALLQRRALRRARTVIPDDPIVASLGLDESELERRGPERRRRVRPPTDRLG